MSLKRRERRALIRRAAAIEMGAGLEAAQGLQTINAADDYVDRRKPMIDSGLRHDAAAYRAERSDAREVDLQALAKQLERVTDAFDREVEARMSDARETQAEAREIAEALDEIGRIGAQLDALEAQRRVGQDFDAEEAEEAQVRADKPPESEDDQEPDCGDEEGEPEDEREHEAA
jgi:hypothetical protein